MRIIDKCDVKDKGIIFFVGMKEWISEGRILKVIRKRKTKV